MDVISSTDTQSLQEIYETINKIETVNQEEATIRPQHDYYPWPLAFALLLLFYWFGRRLWSGAIFLGREVKRE